MLEEAIKENTAAIRELIAAIAKGVPTTAAQVAAVVAEAPKTEKAEKVVTKTETVPVEQDLAASKNAKQAEEALNGHANADTKGVSYDDVKAVIIKVSGAKSRDDVVALLGKFGVAKGPDLKPAQYAEFVAAATELIEA